MFVFGVVELQRFGHGVEDGVGNSGDVAAFEPGVILDADAGELRDLGPAKSAHPTAAQLVREAGLVGGDLSPAGHQEIPHLALVVHPTDARAVACWWESLPVPLNAGTPQLVAAAVGWWQPPRTGAKEISMINSCPPTGRDRPAVVGAARPACERDDAAVRCCLQHAGTCPAPSTRVARPGSPTRGARSATGHRVETWPSSTPSTVEGGSPVGPDPAGNGRHRPGRARPRAGDSLQLRIEQLPLTHPSIH